MAFIKIDLGNEPKNRTPILSISETHICFGKGTLMELGYPQRAVVYLDEENKLLLVQASDAGDRFSISFCDTRDGKKKGLVRIKSSDLRKKINLLSGLDPNKQPYRVRGESTDREGGGVLFDLKEAYYPSKKK